MNTRIAGLMAATGGLTAVTLAFTDTKFHLASKVLGPLLRCFDAETAHRLGIRAATAGLLPVDARPDDAKLAVKLWGRTFTNPLGVAAGFDKDAEAVEGILGMGFGFMEVGSIPPKPQPGNPAPRCFRLPEHGAVINRYGFNSLGSDAAETRLATWRERRASGHASTTKVLAVNLGKNKETEDAAEDFCKGVRQLSPYADVLVINVSSPNTPGLRALQGRKQLKELVEKVQGAMKETVYQGGDPPPLLVKIAPDLSPADKDDIAAVALETALEGLVVSNTTVARPPPVARHPLAAEAGGLSGEPLFEASTELLREMARKTKGRVVLVGCGGVASGAQAYAKIRAGASLVELYTGLVYHGPALVPRIKRELLECLAADGFASVEEAVGADLR